MDEYLRENLDEIQNPKTVAVLTYLKIDSSLND